MGRLYCADTGRPYMVKVAAGYKKVTPSYLPAAFNLVALINLPQSATAGYDLNLTPVVDNAANGIIPLFLQVAGIDPAAQVVNIAAMGSTWGIYDTQFQNYNTFKPAGQKAFAKIYPYVTVSNNNFTYNIATLWSQIQFNEEDFVDVKTGCSVLFGNNFAQGLTGFVTQASDTIIPSGVVGNFGFAFVYLELV